MGTNRTTQKYLWNINNYDIITIYAKKGTLERIERARKRLPDGTKSTNRFCLDALERRLNAVLGLRG